MTDAFDTEQWQTAGWELIGTGGNSTAYYRQPANSTRYALATSVDDGFIPAVGEAIYVGVYSDTDEDQNDEIAGATVYDREAACAFASKWGA